MKELYFGYILRATMLDQQMSPRSLSEQIGVPVLTVAEWLRGESHPSSLSLAKILLSTSKNHYELAESIARRRYRKALQTTITNTINPNPYNFQEEFNSIVADAIIPKKLN